MLIRPATPTDIPAICSMEGRPEFRTFIGSWTPEQHLRTLADTDALYLLSTSPEGAINGFALLRGVQSEDRSIELKRLAVTPPGQGIGRILLASAAAIAFNEINAHRLWLDVFEDNARAQHVYERFGFVVDGILREAIFRDGAFHSLRLMSMLETEYRAKYSTLPAVSL